MSLIGDAQAFIREQKYGQSRQLPPRGGSPRAQPSYMTAALESPGGFQTQSVEQQYDTTKQQREGKPKEKPSGILNMPALTSPLNQQIPELSDLEKAKGYLGIARTGVEAANLAVKGIDSIADTDLGGTVGDTLGSVGAALKPAAAALSAYNIARGKGTPEDYKAVGMQIGRAAPAVIDAITSVTSLGSNIPAISGFGGSGSAAAASTAASSLGSTIGGVVGGISNVAGYNATRELAGAAFGMGARTMQKSGHKETRRAGQQMSTWLARPISENASLAMASQHITRNIADMFGKDNPVSKFLYTDPYVRSIGRAIGYFTNPAAGIVDLFKGSQRKAIKNELKKIQKNPATRVGAAILSGGLSEIFCFAEGTPIEMEDGTTKPVEEVRIGDFCKGGGLVTGYGVCLSGDIYDYQNVHVTGSHAVYEDRKWIRVKDSKIAKPVVLDDVIKVYILNNLNHLLIVNGIIFADFGEVTNSGHMNDDERLEYLNAHCRI